MIENDREKKKPKKCDSQGQKEENGSDEWQYYSETKDRGNVKQKKKNQCSDVCTFRLRVNGRDLTLPMCG